jgi:hypothetical protein
MRQVLIPLLAVLLSDGIFAQAEPAQTEPAQTEPDGASATLPLTLPLKLPSSFFVPAYAFPSTNKTSVKAAPQRSTSPFFSHFTIESFGLGSAPVEPGYMFSSAYIATFYNLQGLECPGCIPGPQNLSRLTLPPFGATATVKLISDHLELFAGFGGIEAWKPDGTFEPQGRRPATSSDSDAWLTQAQAGFRFTVDRDRHLWFGGTGRKLYNFGPGPKEWTTLTGDAIIRFGH